MKHAIAISAVICACCCLVSSVSAQNEKPLTDQTSKPCEGSQKDKACKEEKGSTPRLASLTPLSPMPPMPPMPPTPPEPPSPPEPPAAPDAQDIADGIDPTNLTPPPLPPAPPPLAHGPELNIPVPPKPPRPPQIKIPAQAHALCEAKPQGSVVEFNPNAHEHYKGRCETVKGVPHFRATEIKIDR